MKIFISLFAFVVALLISSAGYGQDSLRSAQQQKPQQLTIEQLKQQQHSYYRQLLDIDSVKAEKVQQIMSAYKAGMKAIEEDQTLSIDAKREKFKALVEEKNKQLKAILNQQEQEKIIPGTERIKAKDN